MSNVNGLFEVEVNSFRMKMLIVTQNGNSNVTGRLLDNSSQAKVYNT